VIATARDRLISVDFPAISTRLAAPMSQHPSLKGKGAIKAKRSVLKRFERVELMKKRGQFKEGQNVIGLPKTKPEF
jgi:small basic protein (TIGR04137 family)